MPFKSKSQQRFMFATKPTMAREFAAHTDFSKLPERVKGKKKKRTKKASNIGELFAIKMAEDAQGPPNYRPSAMPSSSCAACKSFQAGACTRYNVPVDQGGTCDSFEPAISSIELPPLPPPNPMLSSGSTLDTASSMPDTGTGIGMGGDLGAALGKIAADVPVPFPRPIPVVPGLQGAGKLLSTMFKKHPVASGVGTAAGVGTLGYLGAANQGVVKTPPEQLAQPLPKIRVGSGLGGNVDAVKSVAQGLPDLSMPDLSLPDISLPDSSSVRKGGQQLIDLLSGSKAPAAATASAAAPATAKGPEGEAVQTSESMESPTPMRFNNPFGNPYVLGGLGLAGVSLGGLALARREAAKRRQRRQEEAGYLPEGIKVAAVPNSAPTVSNGMSARPGNTAPPPIQPKNVVGGKPLLPQQPPVAPAAPPGPQPAPSVPNLGWDMNKGWYGGYFARQAANAINPQSQDAIKRQHPQGLAKAGTEIGWLEELAGGVKEGANHESDVDTGGKLGKAVSGVSDGAEEACGGTKQGEFPSARDHSEEGLFHPKPLDNNGSATTKRALVHLYPATLGFLKACCDNGMQAAEAFALVKEAALSDAAISTEYEMIKQAGPVGSIIKPLLKAEGQGLAQGVERSAITGAARGAVPIGTREVEKSLLQRVVPTRPTAPIVNAPKPAPATAPTRPAPTPVAPAAAPPVAPSARPPMPDAYGNVPPGTPKGPLYKAPAPPPLPAAKPVPPPLPATPSPSSLPGTATPLSSGLVKPPGWPTKSLSEAGSLPPSVLPSLLGRAKSDVASIGKGLASVGRGIESANPSSLLRSSALLGVHAPGWIGKSLDVVTNLATGKGALQNMMQGNFGKGMAYGAGTVALPTLAASSRGERKPLDATMSGLLHGGGLQIPASLSNMAGLTSPTEERYKDPLTMTMAGLQDVGDLADATVRAPFSRVGQRRLGQTWDTATDLPRAFGTGILNASPGVQTDKRNIENLQTEMKDATPEEFAAKQQKLTDLQNQDPVFQRDTEQYQKNLPLAEEVLANPGNFSSGHRLWAENIKKRGAPIPSSGIVMPNAPNDVPQSGGASTIPKAPVGTDLVNAYNSMNDPNISPIDQARARAKFTAMAGEPGSPFQPLGFWEQHQVQMSLDQHGNRLKEIAQETQAGPPRPELQAEGKAVADGYVDKAFRLAFHKAHTNPEGFMAGITGTDPSNPITAQGMQELGTGMAQQGQPVEPGQLGHIWGGMETWQKALLLAGMGMGLFGLMGMFMGGEGSGAGAGMLGLLGLGTAGMGLSGGKPGELFKKDFWQNIFGTGRDIPNMTLQDAEEDLPGAAPSVAGGLGTAAAQPSTPGVPAGSAPTAVMPPTHPPARAAVPGGPSTPMGASGQAMESMTQSDTINAVRSVLNAGPGRQAEVRDIAANYFMQNPAHWQQLKNSMANANKLYPGAAESDAAVRTAANIFRVAPGEAASLVRNVPVIEKRMNQLRARQAR